MLKYICIIVFMFICSTVFAEPITQFGQGNGVLTIGTILDEKAKYKNVEISNRGDLYGGLTISPGKNWSVSVRYKQLDAEREMSSTYYGQTFSANQHGKVKEGDIIFNFKLKDATPKSPMFSVYGGIKVIKLDIDPKTFEGAVTINTPAGPKTYSGKLTIAGKHGKVVGPMIGMTMVYPNKIADIWIDGHYCHYVNGIEVGLSKEIVKNLLLNVSYFYDRYRYHEYDLSDKGVRVGMSYKFKMGTVRK